MKVIWGPEERVRRVVMQLRARRSSAEAVECVARLGGNRRRSAGTDGQDPGIRRRYCRCRCPGGAGGRCWLGGDKRSEVRDNESGRGEYGGTRGGERLELFY